MNHPAGSRGSHVVGIPAIFIRSDVLAQADPAVWGAPSGHLPAATLPCVDQVSAVGTIRHEIRHFHDALLTPPLSTRFFLEAQRSWLSARILRTVTESGQELEPELREQVEAYHAVLGKLNAGYPAVHREEHIGRVGAKICYTDLLETSAMTSELHFLLADLPTVSDRRARWEALKTSLPATYSRVIDTFDKPGQADGDPDFLKIIERISRLLMWCLYTEEDALIRFAHIMTLSDAEADRLCAPAEIRRGIDQVMQYASVYVDWWTAPETAADFFVTPHDLARAQWKCFEVMTECGFSLDGYQASLAEFPIPPTCFFPDDRMVHARTVPHVRKRTLREAYGDVFSHYYMRDAQRRTVLSAGIIPTPGFDSFIALNKIDSMLGTRYLAQQWFGDHVSYNQQLDASFSVG